MNRILKAIGYSIWKVVAGLSIIITVVSELLLTLTGTNFFGTCKKYPIVFWVSLLASVVGLVFILRYFLTRISPNRVLVRTQKALELGKFIYVFRAAPQIERDSVVEIWRIRNKKEEKYALAYVDTYTNVDHKYMTLQHLAVYDRKDGRYINRLPTKVIGSDNVKQYFYVPFLTVESLKGFNQ